MLFGLLRALARIRVTVAYAAILTGVTSVLMALGPRVQTRVISHASTNLHNLSHGHLGTLLFSAFVIEAGPIYVWLPGLMCLLAVAELMWRSRRLVVAFAAGHIGATLLVAVGLTAAVELGWLTTDVTRATDVGMSYGASAVLGALSGAIPRRLRPAWTGWWLAVAAAVVAVNRDFTDVGHAVALVLGILVSTRFGRAAEWTPVRCLLLVVAAAFGFLMLANNTPTLVAASGLGLVGAVLSEAAVGRRPARRRASRSVAPGCALTTGVA
ncbi:rhomboid-like protein [Mycolicibacterium stellerae]|uniref:rhomboid-like protein n=1 Tax=Mycolicibacterium stellerae TaxID=2358193 RepID=UPI000F0B5092|nr:rhomboid-like protein [Mycolicibacterium stellerae]